MLSLDQAGEGLDRSRDVRPPASLTPWIEAASVQGPRRPPAHGWRIVPDPSPHLIVSVSAGVDAAARAGPAVRATVVGARSRAADSRDARALTLVVRLRPGALPALVREDATVFRDRSVTLADAVTPAPSPVLDRAEAGDGEGALAALFAFLEERFRGAPRPDWRIRALVAEDPGRSPGSVGRRLGVSPRSMRSTAGREVGLPPGAILRIRRLQRALALRLSGAAGSWADASFRAGFYDPAHLVRVSRELLGETPEDFRARRWPGESRPESRQA